MRDHIILWWQPPFQGHVGSPSWVNSQEFIIPSSFLSPFCKGPTKYCPSPVPVDFWPKRWLQYLNEVLCVLTEGWNEEVLEIILNHGGFLASQLEVLVKLGSQDLKRTYSFKLPEQLPVHSWRRRLLSTAYSWHLWDVGHIRNLNVKIKKNEFPQIFTWPSELPGRSQWIWIC